MVKSLRDQLEAVSQERDQAITKTSMESKQSGMEFQHLKYCVDQLLETNAEQERVSLITKIWNSPNHFHFGYYLICFFKLLLLYC